MGGSNQLLTVVVVLRISTWSGCFGGGGWRRWSRTSTEELDMFL